MASNKDLLEELSKKLTSMGGAIHAGNIFATNQKLNVLLATSGSRIPYKPCQNRHISMFLRTYTSRTCVPFTWNNSKYLQLQGMKVDACRKLSENTKTVSDLGPVYETNRTSNAFTIFINAVNQRDYNTVIEIYKQYKNENKIPRKLSTFSSILNVCTKAEHLVTAQEIFQDMIERKLVPSEATFVSLIRCYSDAGDIDSGLEVIKQMREIGISPKLRCYQPLFESLCLRGNIERAIDLALHMSRLNVTLQSEQIGILFESIGKYGITSNELKSSLHGFLEQSSQAILGLNFADMQRIVMALNHETPNETNKEAMIEIESFDLLTTSTNQSSESLTYSLTTSESDEFNKQSNTIGTENSTNKQISGDTATATTTIPLSGKTPVPWKYVVRNGQIGVNPSRAKLVHVDISNKKCLCPNCGDKLRRLFLTENEKLLVRVALTKIASTVSLKQWKNIQTFSDWLKERPEFVYVVDAANVAYHRQNFDQGRFSFQQIEGLVDKLLERGERVLVLIPQCYTFKQIPNSIRGKGLSRVTDLTEDDERIIKKYQDADMLYVVPNGADDDWYWMFVTVMEEREKQAFVVTNDLMRDHKLAFMEPRPFTRWRMCHVVNFYFHNVDAVNKIGRDVSFIDPVPFSREIQRTANGRWHFPSIDNGSWLCTSF